MAEVLQVGSSENTRSAYQRAPSLQTHLSRGAGPQEEAGAVRSAYCKELLTRAGEEFSFEELRAERYNQRKRQQLDERLRRVTEVKEQLSLELEEKKRLLELRTSQQVVPEGPTPQVWESGPPAPSFDIYEESQSSGARPAGNGEKSPNVLPDDVFLRPDERGLCVKIQYPRPGGATAPQKPLSETRKKLSPIQETSTEATSAGNCSSLQEVQEQEEVQVPAVSAGGAVHPCDLDVRRRLLDLCDVTSSPDLRAERRPLPAVEEHSCLQLGGNVFHLYSRVVDGGRFSVYEAAAEDDRRTLIKVDSCSVPWDFHQFQRLKKNSATADGLPLISCFLFLDGCITMYTPPTDHTFTLVSQLHSCRLLHAALSPPILTCCHRGSRVPDWVFPLDWSSSVDLNLQQDVTSLRQVPSAQTYIGLGLLEPSAPPQLVDLVGVAETVHVLLTNSRMVAVKDADGGLKSNTSV
ncbi:mitotic checkpoint serine/threonine-protein kinase BUB1 beta [Pempheris klunzingeri]|uniref:mitotic checkpoint serine/threonine-protein kinase BUB1 beta n=1 Tax=Pempheris klunzingeri TaxID=3127111 RepID=UPI00397F172A